MGAGFADRLFVYFFSGVDVLQWLVDSLVGKHKMGQSDYGGIVFAGLRRMQNVLCPIRFPPRSTEGNFFAGGISPLHRIGFEYIMNEHERAVVCQKNNVAGKYCLVAKIIV